MSCRIRSYTESDLPRLARVYRDAIRGVGAQYYTPEQIDAWSSFAEDTGEFRQWLDEAAIFVAENELAAPVGFAGLEERGRISSLFVAPEAMRRGVGSALLARLMHEVSERRLTRVTTDASEFSRPLFEKFGFKVRRTEHTTFRGVDFERYVMDTLVPLRR